ncbi:M48 family metalloprotease [Pontibacter sp. JH31]|uniref:M48 family metalloprotease n=1 Tax=Pontibacter aquaedesilientis TaxID=2766980 RepID=A0ABR7XGA4_9BACT|nr:M56 family metallopeptidase [Pontibacter aquaedesilientis]MBD1397307.1 M48 family metalloprotease [Pontibacter aquaedesilientis]
MNFSTDFLPETLTSALGWALLHSLWQGALTALVLALLLILLNRHSAKVRYTVSLLGLATVLVLFVFTFVRVYSSEEVAASSIGSMVAYSTQVKETATMSTPALPRFIDSGKVYFETHLPLLVSIWLLGLLVMTLRFLGGLAYIQRLRNYRTQALGAHWQETLAQVKQSMGVRHGVQLVESALVQVPMAIGYFKPVILFPIGAVTGLSQRQVEAVLAHELAHVLRHDYLLNILQQIVETVFFFHPAVWWMSGVVRIEREHCCDDLAVKACGDSVTYARALAQLETLRMPATPAYALALTGNKGSLLSRVKRLVSAADLRPSFGEGFVAALVVVGGFMLLSFGAWAGMKKEPQPEETYTFVTKEEHVLPVALELPEPEEESSVATTLTIQDSSGKTSDIIMIKNKKGKVTELYVNGKRIPKKDIPEFQELIEQRLQATKRAPRMKKAERVQVIKETEEALADVRRKERSYHYTYTFTGPDSLGFEVPAPPIPPAPPAPAVPSVAPRAGMPPMPALPPIPPMPPLTFGEENSKERREAQERHKRMMKKYEQDMARYTEQIEKHVKEVESRAHMQAEASSGKSRETDMRRYQEESLKWHVANMKRHEANMRRHEANMRSHEERTEILEQVRQEMIKDGLLKEGEQVTDFKINQEGLYIHGQKQSQALHSKYRNLMKTREGKPFDLTYKRDGKKVQIQSTQQ